MSIALPCLPGRILHFTTTTISQSNDFYVIEREEVAIDLVLRYMREFPMLSMPF